MSAGDELDGLMRASLAGDRQAYSRLLQLLAPRLRSVVRRTLAGSPDPASDAEEALQEALLAIHLRLDTWRPDAPVLPWACAIARYKAIDLIRQRGRIPVALPLDEITEPAVDAGDGVDTAMDVRDALAALPRYMRVSVEAVKIEGLSVAEASQRTGLSESAVKVGVHRGLKAIAAGLGLRWRRGSDGGA
jgi:RNA polymerase sigma-70 factor (ECF subfamily)